jgi:hypothetical protein
MLQNAFRPTSKIASSAIATSVVIDPTTTPNCADIADAIVPTTTVCVLCPDAFNFFRKFAYFLLLVQIRSRSSLFTAGK